MLDQFSRTTMQLGQASMDRLFSARVAVFGVGGVGGYCVEALCRTGVGSIDIFDDDKVCITNLNRQIIATHKTVGEYKVDVMRERILEINPNARVEAHRLFYLPETADSVNLSVYDYVIDAVDTVTAKLELISRAKAANVPVISSMGAANKLDPTAFCISDIYSTSICPIARVMRRELKKRSVDSLKVVYSQEKPVRPYELSGCAEECPPDTEPTRTSRRQIPSSNAFVPAVAGLIMAGEVIADLSCVTGRREI